jgi:hypothetical protein
MGTANDWITVAVVGVLWAGGMLLCEILSRHDKSIKSILSLANVLGLLLCGQGVGLGSALLWKAFHWPIILLSALAFVGGAVFTRLGKRKLSPER